MLRTLCGRGRPRSQLQRARHNQDLNLTHYRKAVLVVSPFGFADNSPRAMGYR